MIPQSLQCLVPQRLATRMDAAEEEQGKTGEYSQSCWDYLIHHLELDIQTFQHKHPPLPGRRKNVVQTFRRFWLALPSIAKRIRKMAFCCNTWVWHLREVVSLRLGGFLFFRFLPQPYFDGELGLIHHLCSAIAWSCKLELVVETKILFTALHFQGEFPECQQEAKNEVLLPKWFIWVSSDLGTWFIRILCPISCTAKDSVYIYIFTNIHTIRFEWIIMTKKWEWLCKLKLLSISVHI